MVLMGPRAQLSVHAAAMCALCGRVMSPPILYYFHLAHWLMLLLFIYCCLSTVVAKVSCFSCSSSPPFASFVSLCVMYPMQNAVGCKRTGTTSHTAKHHHNNKQLHNLHKEFKFRFFLFIFFSSSSTV